MTAPAAPAPTTPLHVPQPPTALPPPADDATSAVHAWARAIEAGVLARAARDDPQARWRGDATDAELRALEEAGARAQREFVAANLGLVGAVLGGYARSGAPVADLFQEGCLGLITAVERFDHRRGVRFSTYATYWIRNAVGAASSRSTGALSVPAGRSGQLRVARGVEAALAQRLGRHPTLGEVASALGRDERWTARLLGQRSARPLDDLDEAVLHRLVAVETPPADTGAEPEVWARRLLATLDGFDRSVLELRLGFGGREARSLAATARELGVPIGRVRRAEARALEQLRGRCPRAVLTEVAS